MPIALGLVAGALAALNPCGFPLLPAFLSLYVGAEERRLPRAASRVGQGLVVGALVTGGFLGVFALIGIPISYGATEVTRAVPWASLAVGAGLAVAGDFEVPTLSGKTLSSAELKSRPMVVNFWASWCVPCSEEAPLLERAWRAYRDEGVMFLGVNIRDAKSDAQAFVDEFDITYPVVRDVDGRLNRAFGVRGLPETFFIDHRWCFVGAAAGTRPSSNRGP